MKYNAQELYQWAVEHETIPDLVETLYFNNRGFIARPLTGKLSLKDGQYYFISKVNDDFTIEEPLGNGSEEQNQVIAKISKHPEVMKVAIIARRDKYQVRFAFADTDKERKEELDRKMIIGMLDFLSIDTIGKMKKLIEDSKENRASQEAMNLIGEGIRKRNEKENGKQKR